MAETQIEEIDGGYLAYYCVLFVDVLGQRERLRELKGLPKTESEQQEIVEILRDTAGFLMSLREWYGGFLESYLQESEWVKGLPDEIRANLREARATKVSFRYFSDSIILSTPLLDNKTEYCVQMNGVMALLLAGCGMHLLALSTRKALRGGIDVGLAMHIDDDEIYGAALERPVYLEAKVACYPRIVVGRELIEFLDAVDRMNPKTPFGAVAKETARHARRLIFEDYDGQQALDFLGDEMIAQGAGQLEHERIDECFKFVREERARFTAEGNEVLAERYGLLWNYLETRALAWGIAPSAT